MLNADRKEIETKVKEALAKELGIKIENITPDKKLVDDLGMDSFASVELMFDLEDKMGVDIPDSDAVNLKTVDDIITYLNLRIAEKNANKSA